MRIVTLSEREIKTSTIYSAIKEKHIVISITSAKDNEIVFEIKYQGFWGTEYITYNINNTSIKILKQQINGAMFRIIERYEDNLANSEDWHYCLKEAMEYVKCG